MRNYNATQRMSTLTRAGIAGADFVMAQNVELGGCGDGCACDCA